MRPLQGFVAIGAVLGVLAVLVGGPVLLFSACVFATLDQLIPERTQTEEVPPKASLEQGPPVDPASRLAPSSLVTTDVVQVVRREVDPA